MEQNGTHFSGPYQPRSSRLSRVSAGGRCIEGSSPDVAPMPHRNVSREVSPTVGAHGVRPAFGNLSYKSVPQLTGYR